MSSTLTPATPPELLSRREVAQLLRVHPNTVSRLRALLPPLQISLGVWRWRRQDVIAYLDRLAAAARPA